MLNLERRFQQDHRKYKEYVTISYMFVVEAEGSLYNPMVLSPQVVPQALVCLYTVQTMFQYVCARELGVPYYFYGISQHKVLF